MSIAKKDLAAQNNIPTYKEIPGKVSLQCDHTLDLHDKMCYLAQTKFKGEIFLWVQRICKII